MEIALARKCRHLLAAEVAAGPGGSLAPHLRTQGRRSAQLAAQHAAGLERAPRLGQIVAHDFGVGDVLENGVGIDEIEIRVPRHGQVRAAGNVHVRVGGVAQALPRHGGHFRGDVHPVDLSEMPAHGQHQPSWTTADLERPPRGSGRRRQTHKFLLQDSGHLRRAGQKLRLILVLPGEGHIEVGILPGPPVPVLAHAVPDIHVPMLPRPRRSPRKRGARGDNAENSRSQEISARSVGCTVVDCWPVRSTPRLLRGLSGSAVNRRHRPFTAESAVIMKLCRKPKSLKCVSSRRSGNCASSRRSAGSWFGI